MGANIITGYTGTRHITPAMDASVYRSVFGQDEYIMSEGNKLEGSMPTINDFTVLDGLVSMQGHMIQVTQETLSVDTCATGYERIDLICLRFMHDNETLIDSCELVVIKGTEVQSGNTPVEPAHNTGVIDEGASAVDMLLYRIRLSGSTVTFTKLFNRAYDQQEQKTLMLDLFYPVGSYYETSNTSFNPNTAWGGTWELEAEGKVHVSAGSTYIAGSSYGSDTHTHTTSGHTLTVDEMPSHNHTATITKNVTVANITNWASVGSGSSRLGVEAASVTIGNKGGGKSHSHGDTGSTTRNSWQPSIAVNRWHRTA